MAKPTDPTPDADPSLPPVIPVPVTPVNPLVAASNIPNVEDAPNIPIASSDVPKIADYKGSYVSAIDGELYALAIKEDAPDNKTHFVLNTKHFGNMTKEDFKRDYDKK